MPPLENARWERFVQELARGKSQTEYDPPPLKWSDLRYVFDIKEDCSDTSLEEIVAKLWQVDVLVSVSMAEHRAGEAPEGP
jgi:hypothetical protein